MWERECNAGGDMRTRASRARTTKLRALFALSMRLIAASSLSASHADTHPGALPFESGPGPSSP